MKYSNGKLYIKINKNGVIPGIINWYGSLALFSSYLLITLSLVKSADLFFQLLNLTGCISILISLRRRSFQPKAFYLVWLIIAVVMIIKITLKI